MIAETAANRNTLATKNGEFIRYGAVVHLQVRGEGEGERGMGVRVKLEVSVSGWGERGVSVGQG